MSEAGQLDILQYFIGFANAQYSDNIVPMHLENSSRQKLYMLLNYLGIIFHLSIDGGITTELGFIWPQKINYH